MQELETVIWLITARCNLACSTCYASRYEGELEVGFDSVVKVLREAVEAGVTHLHITGGEPLLRRDTLDIVEEALNLGLEATLFTNATVLTEGAAARIGRLGIKVYTSIDGPTRRIHESVRGVGSWDALLRGLRMLREGGVRLHVNVTVSEINWRWVAETLRRALELGADEVSIIPAMPAGRAFKLGTYVRPHHYLRALLDVENLAEELGVEVEVWCTPFLRLVATSPLLVNGNCRDWGVMDVTPSGKSVVCDVIGVVTADVLKDGLKRAWERTLNHPIIKAAEAGGRESPCINCPIRDACRGGCYARSYILRGRADAPDPLCPRVSGLLNRLGR